MGIVLRLIAVLFVAIGAALIYFVIHAMASAGGARPGVAVAYVVGALILGFAAMKLWTAAGRRNAGTATV
jgi:hypothetical protein